MKKLAALKSKLLTFLIFFALPLGILALCFPSPIRAHVGTLNFEKVVEDSGEGGREVHLCFGIFNNVLYAGVGDEDNGSSIYKSSTGAEGSWSEVASFNNDDEYIKDFEEFGGYFYAATGSDSLGLAAEILRSSDGETWVDLVDDGFGNPFNYRINALEVFKGYLYAGTQNPLSAGQIWRTQNGTTWETVSLEEFDSNDTGIMSLFAFGDYLYAGTFNNDDGASIYRTANGEDWSKVASAGLGNPNNVGVYVIVSYRGVLYAGTANTTDGVKLYYSTDGETWSQRDLTGDFDTLPNIWPSFQPTIVNGLAYSGTRVATGSAGLYATNGEEATQIGEDGFGDPDNFALYALTFFKGRIYAGFSNGVTGLQIWRSEEQPTLSIANNQTLPSATVGKSYSVSLETAYGTPPYTFSLVGGSLPAGLFLSSSGLIYGTPTHNSSYTFTVRVTDSGFPAQTYDKTFVLGVTTEETPSLPETGIAGRKSPSTSYSLTMLAILTAGIAAVNLPKKQRFNLRKLTSKRLAVFGRVLVISLLSLGLGMLPNLTSRGGGSVVVSPKPVSAEEPSAFTPPVDLDQRFQKFGLYIEKLGLKVPITENVDGSKKEAYEKPLLLGLAHYSGTSLPGEGGNIFLFGHSTAGPVTNSYYGYTFAKISELTSGDKIIVVKNGVEFTYKVVGKSIVNENDLSVLDPTDRETLTLMTCWPAGKSDSRLIVRANPI